MDSAALIETAAAIAFANRGRRTLTFPFAALVCAEMPWPPVLDKNDPNIWAFDWNVAAIFFKMMRPFFNFPAALPRTGDALRHWWTFIGCYKPDLSNDLDYTAWCKGITATATPDIR